LGVALAGGGMQIQGPGRVAAAKQEECHHWVLLPCLTSQRGVLNPPFQGRFLLLMQRVSEWQDFPLPRVRFFVAL
jgi:hypothetical protein